jgi:hypothetical protein
LIAPLAGAESENEPAALAKIRSSTPVSTLTGPAAVPVMVSA